MITVGTEYTSSGNLIYSIPDSINIALIIAYLSQNLTRTYISVAAWRVQKCVRSWYISKKENAEQYGTAFPSY